MLDPTLCLMGDRDRISAGGLGASGPPCGSYSFVNLALLCAASFSEGSELLNSLQSLPISPFSSPMALPSRASLPTPTEPPNPVTPCILCYNYTECCIPQPRVLSPLCAFAFAQASPSSWAPPD